MRRISSNPPPDLSPQWLILQTKKVRMENFWSQKTDEKCHWKEWNGDSILAPEINHALDFSFYACGLSVIWITSA